MRNDNCDSLPVVTEVRGQRWYLLGDLIKDETVIGKLKDVYAKMPKRLRCLVVQSIGRTPPKVCIGWFIPEADVSVPIQEGMCFELMTFIGEAVYRPGEGKVSI